MNGALLCKSAGHITLIDSGDYYELSRMLDIVKSFAPANSDIQLVDTTGLNMKDIESDSKKVNDAFENYFSNGNN